MNNELVVLEEEKELTPDQREKVNEIIKDIDIKDSTAILSYGVSSQKGVSTFANNILKEVQVKDTGAAGDMLQDLMLKVKQVDVNTLQQQGNFLSKLPLIGSAFNKFEKFRTQFETVNVQVDRIVEKLEVAKQELMKDMLMLDGMFDKNKEHFDEVTLYIHAGEEKLKEINEQTIPNLKEKAEVSNDPKDIQELNDMIQLASRFEKKLHDLKLTRQITIQSAPQIRLIQNNNQILAEKIQSSILNTIPIWQSQMVLAISLHKQKGALELQKNVTDTTNELLQKNSAMLKQGTIDTARESERGIVSIETLKQTHTDLISTLEETIKIQQDGRSKRQSAEQELIKMESELKQKIKELV